MFLGIMASSLVFSSPETDTFPAGIYLLEVNNRNTRARGEICSKSKIKRPERHHWRRSCVFIVNSEHISHLVLMFVLLTLNIACWVIRFDIHVTTTIMYWVKWQCSSLWELLPCIHELKFHLFLKFEVVSKDICHFLDRSFILVDPIHWHVTAGP